jgi:predicted permease
MRQRRGIRRYIRLPWRSDERIRADLDTELQFHIAMRQEELVGNGMSEDEARRESVREFGDLAYTRQYCEALDRSSEQEARRADWLSELAGDVRHSVQGMVRRPGFALIAILTLALGIGANAAVFSVLQSVLLRPLPYAEPDRLALVDEHNVRADVAHSDIAPGEYLDWVRDQRTFDGIAVYTNASLTYTGGSAAERLSARAVTANFFDVLGVRPAIGRTFVAGEDQGVHRVAVIADGLWQRLFGADSAIVGRTAMFNGTAYEIIGILPPEFVFPGQTPQLFVPADMAAAAADPNRVRKFHRFHGFGRLRPGVSFAQARADLVAISRAGERAHPDESLGHLATVEPLRSALVSDVRPVILALMGAAAFVLLIACANVANLSLSRAISRRREFAVRAALGAGRGRLIRQALTESTTLAVVAGAVGAAVAWRGTPLLLALYPSALPPTYTVSVDVRVLPFSIVLATATGLVFGLIPALGASRTDAVTTLRDGSRNSTGGVGGMRIRRVLLVTQVALAMVLLVGAGLLIRTLAGLQSIPLGFAPDNVATTWVSVSGPRYQTRQDLIDFWDVLLERLAREREIQSVAISGSTPLNGGSGASLAIDGRPNAEPLPELRYTVASEDFLQTLQVPLRAGRGFTREDRAAPRGVVIINEAAARRFWPEGDPIGARVRLGPDPSEPWMEVIGVAGDYRQESLSDPAPPLAITMFGHDVWSTLALTMRTSASTDRVKEIVGAAIREIDPAIAVGTVGTISGLVDETLAPRRLAMALLGVFAGIAFALAVIGVYGVVGYGVAARAREFGIRIALGALPRSVTSLVLHEGTRLAVLGLVLGTLGAVALTRFMAGMLFGVEPVDALTFAIVGALLLAATLVACAIPARQAASADPARTLRED